MPLLQSEGDENSDIQGQHTKIPSHTKPSEKQKKVKMKKKQKIILFGASLRGLQVLNHVRDHYIIIGFVDNDKNKQGSSVSGIMVYAPSMIMELNPDIVFISSMYSPEIYHQIVRMGFPARKIRNVGNKWTSVLSAPPAQTGRYGSDAALTYPVNLILSNRKQYPQLIYRHAEAIALALTEKYSEAVSRLHSLMLSDLHDPMLQGTASRIFGILQKKAQKEDTEIMSSSGWITFSKEWFKLGLAPSPEQTVLVSVIVPVYKTEAFLAKCLDSLTQQTLGNLQIIIVNDESPDQSQVIIDAYQNRFPDLIESYNKPNGGLSSARNHGMKHARGQFIGFVDSDDFVEPNMYETLWDAAHLNHLQISIGQYYHYPIGGRIAVNGALLLEDNLVYHGRDFLLQSNVMVVWNKIYDRSLVNPIPFPDTWFEDVAWSPIVLSFAERIGYVPVPFYHYIRRDNAQTAAMADPRTLQGITAMQYALNHCKTEEREAVVYMALRRLLFEAQHRIGYADRYYAAIKELENDIKHNRYIKENRWLNTQAKRLLYNRPLIPKVLYYARFDSAPPSSQQLLCEESWQKKLMLCDGQVYQLNTQNCNMELNPGVSAAYKRGEFKLLGDYFRLKSLCEKGGIAISSNVRANAFIAKKLTLGAFFSYNDKMEIFDGIFAAIPRHEVTMLALKKMDALMTAEPVPENALSLSIKESLQELYHFSADGARFNYGGQTFVFTEDIFFTNMGNNDPNARFSTVNITECIRKNECLSQDGRIDNLKCLELESLKRYVERCETTVREEMEKRLKALFADAEELSDIKGRPLWKTYETLSRVLNEYKKYRQTRTLFKQDKELSRRAQYSHFLTRLKVNPKLVLLESFYGRGLLSSPYALFLAWQKRPDFKTFHFVWVLDDCSKHGVLISEYSSSFSNIGFVDRSSIDYYRHLASAGYLINDVSFPFDFVKRDEQIYINTWHSITVKTLGYDIPGNPLDQKNVIRNFLSCDYFLAPNTFMREQIFLQTHRMSGLYPGKILEEGHPRDDLTFSCTREEIIAEWKNAGVHIQGAKKIIMYAPTWRGTNVHAPSDDIDEYKDVLQKIRFGIDQTEFDVVLRVHHLADAKVRKEKELSGIVIPSSIDANRCFCAVDVLITDYSSIYFDFMVTRKPVLFYIKDLETYKKYRGVYFSPEELPGPATADLPKLVEYLRNLDQTQEQFHEIYEKTKAWACPHEDGHVSERVLTAVLDGKETSHLFSDDTKDKKKILFYAGPMLDTHSTLSLFTILQKIDRRGYDISVLIDDRGSTEALRHAERLLKMGCRPLGRSDHTVFSAREYNSLEVTKRKKTLNPRQSALINKAMKREWRRCFGLAHFDFIVNLDNESTFHAYLLLNGSAGKKIVFQRFDEIRTPQIPSQKHIPVTYAQYDIAAFDESEIIAAIGASYVPCSIESTI